MIIIQIMNLWNVTLGYTTTIVGTIVCAGLPFLGWRTDQGRFAPLRPAL